MAPRLNVPVRRRQLRVFYRDYVNDVAVPSSRPQWLAVDRIAPLAEQLLTSADNFLGVVDHNDVILQCYLGDDTDQVTFEMLYPEASGCLRLIVTREDALERLADLPEAFDEGLLRGGQYID